MDIWDASADGGQTRGGQGGGLINSFAVSDSDINQTGTRAILSTPTVEIPADGIAFLSLNNNYRHYGDSVGDIDIVIDGGAPTDLVDLVSDSFGAVSFALPVSSSTQTMSFIFDYRSIDADGGPNAGQFQNVNEWWWAFDDIKIQAEGDPLNSVRKSWEIYD